MADTASPGRLTRPKVQVTKLNRLAQACAVGAASLGIGVLMFSFTGKPQPAEPMAAQATVAPPQANARHWWADRPDGYPAPEPVVVYEPAPAPEPEPAAEPAPVEVAQAQAPELPPQGAPALHDTSPSLPYAPPADDAAQRRREALEAARASALLVAGFGQGQGVDTARPPAGGERAFGQEGVLPAGYFPDSAGGASDDPNLQGAKRRFLEDARQADEPDYVPAAVKRPLSPFEVKAGWIIPAVLVTGISSDLPGQIIAQVREHVYDTATGRYLLIPQGARLVGVYDSRVAYGQSRLLVAWNRIIFPDGSSLQIRGQPGADLAGLAGFKDKVDRHYWRLFGSAILLSVVGAGAQLSQPQESADDGEGVSVRQQIAAAVGAQIAAVSGRLLDRNLNVQPELRIRPGYRFNILVTADLVLPGPYQE